MKPLYGLYEDTEAAERALHALVEAGVDARQIVVLSSEPLEGDAWSRSQRTRMGWLAALGGLLGGFSGYLLTALTQLAYPIVTGAMPVVTRWTNGIIIYEMTMLGVILGTLLTLLISARLPNWKAQLYDPAIAEGRILVGLADCPEDTRAELERTLQQGAAHRP